MNRKLLAVTMLLFQMCWIVPEAIAASSVTIAPASDNSYVVQGNDLTGTSGIDITIRYDAAALANPVVMQGGLVAGALMAVNSATPGMVRLALVRVTEIKGSGAIATVTFTRLKSAGADIQALSSLVLVAGRNTPIPSRIVNAPTQTGTVATASADQPADQPARGSSPTSVPETDMGITAGTPATAATTPSTVVVGLVAPSTGASTAETRGSVPPTSQNVPEVQQPERETVPPTDAVKEPSKETVVAKAVEPERKKVMMQQSVLERFKEFKGKKTPEALMALFTTQDKGAQQDPAIVLSNGKSTVTIVLELDSKGENNNFRLDGVSLVSLTNKEKDQWFVELLPDARTYEATVSVPWKGQLYVLPLTIASPLDVTIDRSSGRLTEADFRLFLKEKGTDKAPRFDLNKDGRRDYIDDFIFTANYLVQRDSTANQGTPVRK